MKYYKDASNTVFAYETDGSQDSLIEGKILITKEEADALLAQQRQTVFSLLPYSQKRLGEYPSIQEQLDMQYWDLVNGTTTWQDAINAVKAKYPKGV